MKYQISNKFVDRLFYLLFSCAHSFTFQEDRGKRAHDFENSICVSLEKFHEIMIECIYLSLFPLYQHKLLNFRFY